MENREIKDHVLVVQATNFRWILGHWVREISARVPGKSTIWWTPISFSRTNMLNEILKTIPLPKSRGYYFTQPTLFENYLKKNSSRVIGRSVVLYTHNDVSLGDDLHQVSVLSMCNSVHFMCSNDAERLVEAGLPLHKARVIYGAVDNNCFKVGEVQRNPKSILLSSKYGSRKGGSIISELIKSMPDWKFTIFGTGWEGYISTHKLNSFENFEYIVWDEDIRNLLMSEHEIFLSLSSLEGGPIPLIEGLNCGMFAIATDTGFARDVIMQNINGKVLPIDAGYELIRQSILESKVNESQSIESVATLTWDRLARFYLNDVDTRF